MQIKITSQLDKLNLGNTHENRIIPMKYFVKD